MDSVAKRVSLKIIKDKLSFLYLCQDAKVDYGGRSVEALNDLSKDDLTIRTIKYIYCQILTGSLTVSHQKSIFSPEV
jgi:hypothetical protein